MKQSRPGDVKGKEKGYTEQPNKALLGICLANIQETKPTQKERGGTTSCETQKPIRP